MNPNHLAGRRLLLVGVVSAACVATFVSDAARGYERPGITERISVGLRGAEASHHSGESAISADGRYVAFNSQADNLVSNDTNRASDTFVRDRLRNETTRISVSSAGAQAITPIPIQSPGSSWPVAISDNGRLVVFQSSATNLVPGDTNLAYDVFLHDRAKARTERLTVSSQGRQATYPPGGVMPGLSDNVSITANGRFVVFDSFADDLVRGDTNDTGDLFLRDRKTGRTTIISRPRNGRPQEDRQSGNGSITAGGRYIDFQSSASNLVPGEEDEELRGNSFHYVYDRKKRRFDLLRLGSDRRSTGVYGGLGNPHISNNGRYVTFTSPIRAFVPNDTNGCPLPGAEALEPGTCLDIFVHDRKTGRTERISVTPWGGEKVPGTPSGDQCFGPTSYDPSISSDGRIVVFGSSMALVEDDTETTPGGAPCGAGFGVLPDRSDQDIYLHDMLTGSTMMVSRDSRGREALKGDACEFPLDGFQANDPAMSRRGDFVSWWSCSTSLVKGDEEDSSTGRDEDDVFLREVGRVLSSQVTIGGRVSTPGVVTVPDSPSDASGVSGTGELIALRLAHRPVHSDLYVRLDATRVAPSRDGRIIGVAPTYRVEIEVDGRIYEARAMWAPVGGRRSHAIFGLFDCTRAPCGFLREIDGGYGTVGEAVVMSVPSEALGVEGVEEIDAVTGSSGMGLPDAGFHRIDSVTRRLTPT